MSWAQHLRSIAAACARIKSMQDIAETLVSAAEEIDRLRARLSELESGEVATEYGVRWPADASHGPDTEHDDRHEVQHGTRDSAERVAAMYRSEGAELVQRRICRGPWAVAS